PPRPAGWGCRPPSGWIRPPRSPASPGSRGAPPVVWSWSESHPDAEVEGGRHGEVAEIDPDAARPAHRRVVAVHDRIEAGVVGDQQEVAGLDEDAGAARAEEALPQIVAHLHVSQPQPVDVLLDELLDAHVGVVRRLLARDDDDRVP